MEILLNNFRSYLEYLKISPVTVKNYLADVKRFLAYYFQKYNSEFSPASFTAPLLEDYKLYLTGNHVPLPNINRYLSSLRKFGDFLTASGYLSQNPGLSITNLSRKLQPQGIMAIEVEILRSFKQYLWEENISQITSKNYLSDLHKFLTWLLSFAPEKLSTTPWQILEEDLFNYKNFLLSAPNTSPRTINRYLSSLKKFLIFAKNRNFLLVIPSQSPSPETSPVFQSIPKEVYAPEEVSQNGWPLPKKLLHNGKITASKYTDKYHIITIPRLFAYGFIIALLLLLGLKITAIILPPSPESLVKVTSPRLISYQGKLLDLNNDPIIKPTKVIFKLYNSPSQTKPLWTSAKRNLSPDNDGSFFLILGNEKEKDQRIPDSIFYQNYEIYLGIQVENDREMTPRQKIPNFAYTQDSRLLNGFSASKPSSIKTTNSA